MRLSVSDFMLRCLIFLELSFVQGSKYGSVCILLHADIQFVEDAVFFPVCISGFLIKNQLSIGMWIYIWVFIDSVDQ